MTFPKLSKYTPGLIYFFAGITTYLKFNHLKLSKDYIKSTLLNFKEFAFQNQNENEKKNAVEMI